MRMILSNFMRTFVRSTGRFAVVAMSVSFALAQTQPGLTGPNFVGSGYRYPSPIYVAPGQLMTVFSVNPKLSMTTSLSAATNLPLPTSLGDFRVNVWSGVTIPAPMTMVVPFWTRANSALCILQCTGLLATTFQVPFEVREDAGAVINLFDNTAPGGAVDAIVRPDQIHVLTDCDPLLSTVIYGRERVCAPMVVHADGGLVTAAHPAQPGEVITAYAVGLGITDPPLQTGKPALQAARTQSPILIDVNYHANAQPSRPVSVTAVEPLYAGATPGYVGLYQINFVVPPMPTGTIQCTPLTPEGSIPQGGIQSNLTVSFGGRSSYDGAGICVTSK